MNILIARSGGLGDCLLTLPVAALLKERYARADLHVLGNAAMCSVATVSGTFDAAHSFESGEYHTLYYGGSSPFLHTFFSGYDRIYYYTSASGDTITASILESGARHCRVLDPRPPPGFQGHIVEHLVRIVENAPRNPPVPSIPRLPSRAERYDLLIHPGSGSAEKNWPLDRFLDSADRMPGHVAFVIGPAEIENIYGERIRNAGFDVLEPSSLESLCALLQSSSRYLGNDSGVTHCAALCGIPVVALFGPTDAAAWRPLGDRVTVVISPDGSMGGIGVTEAVKALRAGM